jgi:Domain of unknown function (DUF4105)
MIDEKMRARVCCSALISRVTRVVGWAIVSVIALGCAIWACGALYYDLPRFNVAATWAFALAILAALIFLRGVGRKLGAIFVGSALVLAWWLTLKPSNHRLWQPDVAREPWAEVNGDSVTLHNVRNCDYRSESDYTPHWETRMVRLSQLTGIDLAINYWGSPWMAHPIASFQFADGPPLCFSIEVRREIGESYSAIGGFFRQFELIYIVADERDVLRVRTNFRRNEDVYLYRTTASPEKARERFTDYIRALNALHAQPRWYNAATTNCTTSIRTQHAAAQRSPWDWRILFNGKADELLFERGALLTGGLPFSELKARSLINAVAKAADSKADFSRLIRIGLPASEPQSEIRSAAMPAKSQSASK